MSTSPFAGAALRISDAEIDAGAWEHLRLCESPLYHADAHGQVRERLRLPLLELLDVVRERLDSLDPPAPPAEGDVPPALPERPVPKIVSESIHG